MQDLLEKFGSETSGNFGELCKMLLTDRSIICAGALYYAMKGAGTNEYVILEILCTSSNAEIRQIKEAYSKRKLNVAICF